ncbi:MAG TPA: hypothetical protein VGN83_03645 [Falsiroseomonas sp.]|nr:hypothetical protein [Falsiroseomonas sp.]
MFNDLAVEVDAREARSRHFAEPQPMRGDEELICGARYARRDMRIDQVIEPVMGAEAIRCRDVEPDVRIRRGGIGLLR